MNDFPQRDQKSVADERGIVLLQAIFDPQDHIYRYIGGRDYGIDGMLELVDGADVTGKLISLQLKSSIHFEGVDYISLYNIKHSTCNYWLNCDLPVMLVLADLRNECVYYSDAKEQIRHRYSEFTNNEHFIFRVDMENVIKKLSSNPIASEKKAYELMWHRYLDFERRMITYREFEDKLKDFVLHRRDYYDHILHQDCDPFLTQPLSFYERTLKIDTFLKDCADRIGIVIDDINYTGIRGKYKDAYDSFGIYDKEGSILEIEITEMHQKLQKNLEAIIEPLKEHIFSEEDYWRVVAPNVLDSASRMTLKEFQTGEYEYWYDD